MAVHLALTTAFSSYVHIFINIGTEHSRFTVHAETGANSFHSILSFYFRQRSQYRRNNKLNTKTGKTVEKYTKTHKTHTKSNQDKKRAYMHIYTTTSDFTKAILHAFQHAASDFLALFIKVSKLGKPVNSNIVVTL